MKKNILVIEDDKSTYTLLEATVQEAGHIVQVTKSLGEAKEALSGYKPDLIVMDRGLPDGDGIQLCITLKKDSRFKFIPILMLTGKDKVEDKVLGLRFGADDYLAKPFDIEEFLARVDALMRRSQMNMSSSSKINFGGISMDLRSMEVVADGEIIFLSNMEYELLRVFMERPDEVLTREFLLKTIWADAQGVGQKTVDVTVMNLRKKLDKKGSLIASIRSHGYKITKSKK